jgi:hypothetical protein
MNVDEIYASSLTHKQLSGQDKVVTIAGGEIRTFDGKKKIVLRFAETPQPLVVNKTNAKAIAAVLGTGELTQWPGRQITLYVAQTEYAGETVGCIRVRQQAIAPPTPPAAAAPRPVEAGVMRF